MADLQLSVDVRTVTGKKVKSLRRQGILPAHLYGRGTDSQSLQAPIQQIVELLKTAGRNAIIDLTINGEGEARPVVLRGVARNPFTDELYHVDFFQVSLTEKLRADVPLVLVGEAPAVMVHNGVLLQNLDRLAIEALPTDVPPKIEVDVSGLEELEAGIFVRDLNVPSNVDVLAAPDLLVAKVEPPKIAAELEAEEAAAAAAEAEALPEGEEGEEVEGEEGAPGEEGKEEPSTGGDS